MQIFEILFYQPIFNIVIFLYRLFGDNLGVALIMTALLARIITIPITNKQLKSAEVNKEMQAKMAELKKKHKNNKEKYQEEAAKLQAQYLPGQLGGCLPMIIQLIMFFNIFSVLNNLINKGTSAFNEVAYGFVDKFAEGESINMSFLGSLFDLHLIPSKDLSISNIGEFWPYGLLIIALVATQFYSMRIMSPSSNKSKKEEKSSESKKEKSKKKGKDGKDREEPDFAEIMQQTNKQMMYTFPLFFAFIAYRSPVGLSLYWTVQSAFVIIQKLFTKENLKVFLNVYKNRTGSGIASPTENNNLIDKHD